MKGDCKGKCESPKFQHDHQARPTRSPVYDHGREWYCHECEKAYPGKSRDTCPCCGRLLRTKPKNRSETMPLSGRL